MRRGESAASGTKHTNSPFDVNNGFIRRLHAGDDKSGSTSMSYEDNPESPGGAKNPFTSNFPRMSTLLAGNEEEENSLMVHNVRTY